MPAQVRGRPQPQDVLWSHDGKLIEYGRVGGRLQVDLLQYSVINGIEKSSHDTMITMLL